MLKQKENDQQSDSDVGEALLRLGAAVYARVSSTGQLGRDGDEDGYSIPAQVKAAEQKAKELGAKLEKAYIERADRDIVKSCGLNSAESFRRRPVPVFFRCRVCRSDLLVHR